MRDFMWNYFSKTGDIDAYMLYKEISPDEPEIEEEPEELWAEWDGDE